MVIKFRTIEPDAGKPAPKAADKPKAAVKPKVEAEAAPEQLLLDESSAAPQPAKRGRGKAKPAK